MKNRNIVLKYCIVFLMVVAIACVFLLAGGLLPQKRIDRHVADSMEQFKTEKAYPIVFHKGEKTFRLDNYTDMTILMESQSMNLYKNVDSVFLNPVYFYFKEGGNIDMLKSMQESIDGAEANHHYSRYWMGFRSVFRGLLLFFDYAEIRTLVCCAFFLLFALAGIQIHKASGTPAALAFLLAVILVNPVIISMSLQFSCCFILAFSAMLLVPYAIRKKWDKGLLFFVIGMLTQFFDFYTAPIIVYGLPVCFYILAGIGDTPVERWKSLGITLLSWLAGYGLMWIAKLALTTIFTGEDAFETAFGSFAVRTGIVQPQDYAEHYDVFAAIGKTFSMLLSKPNLFILCLAAICFAAVALVRRKSIIWDRRNVELLAVSVLPLLWYACSAQATSIHAWFQYRALVVVFFAILLCLTNSILPARKEYP